MNDKHKLFISQVRAAKSINFPLVAKELGLNWFKELKPLLKSDKEFLSGLEETIEEIRYHLLSLVFKAANDGKQGVGKDPDVHTINAAIKHIDSGALLGIASDDAGGSGLTEEQLKKHLERLNMTAVIGRE